MILKEGTINNSEIIMSDNENGPSLSISSTSSRRTSSDQSLEESIRKILITGGKGVNDLLERYAVRSEGCKVLKFLYKYI